MIASCWISAFSCFTETGFAGVLFETPNPKGSMACRRTRESLAYGNFSMWYIQTYTTHAGRRLRSRGAEATELRQTSSRQKTRVKRRNVDCHQIVVQCRYQKIYRLKRPHGIENGMDPIVPKVLIMHYIILFCEARCHQLGVSCKSSRLVRTNRKVGRPNLLCCSIAPSRVTAFRPEGSPIEKWRRNILDTGSNRVAKEAMCSYIIP